jgi:hypothetical protein
MIQGRQVLPRKEIPAFFHKIESRLPKQRLDGAIAPLIEISNIQHGVTMKNIKFLFLILMIAAISLSGCGKKAKDVNVTDLKSAYHFVDAMDLILGETSDLVGNSTSKADLSAEQTTDLQDLIEKLKEVSDAADRQYKRSDAEKCPNFEKIQEKGEKLEGFFVEV